MVSGGRSQARDYLRVLSCFNVGGKETGYDGYTIRAWLWGTHPLSLGERIP